jgi:hypothetical protein
VDFSAIADAARCSADFWDFDLYRPKGLCAHCLTHPATEVWQIYVGTRRFEFRCKCCVAEGHLEKAIAYRDRIPFLEKALAQAQGECDGESGHTERTDTALS